MLALRLAKPIYLLKEAIRDESFEMDLHYVGVDIDQSYVAAARDLFCGDDRFQIVHGDGADLSRFADKSFDLVISNGVYNSIKNQGAAFREAVRVSRIGALHHLVLNFAPNNSEFVSAINVSHSYKVPTIGSLIDDLTDCNPVNIYLPTRKWRKISLNNGRYIGKSENPNFWNIVLMSKLDLDKIIKRR
jgi:ubiquinone/menaquinone biosynthesis C-methylase UbiE